MKILNSFKSLSHFELCLWLFSVLSVSVSFAVCGTQSVWNAAASLIGVTALIFVAKGYVLGQVLTVVFSVFYGVISFFFQYYGEMITYMCMTAPIAVISIISWLRHPYKDTGEVEVSTIAPRQIASMLVLAAAVTAVFYFLLGALGTENHAVSTLSVTTSFTASFLTYLRSPYYAIAYALNDVVLIILWILAALESVSYLPMVVCFAMFLANDLYGFYNWRRMKKRQSTKV